jgi:hypothetical protein
MACSIEISDIFALSQPGKLCLYGTQCIRAERQSHVVSNLNDGGKDFIAIPSGLLGVSDDVDYSILNGTLTLCKTLRVAAVDAWSHYGHAYYSCSKSCSGDDIRSWVVRKQCAIA